MDKKSRKFLVDMLNLIFGRGEETDYFWQQMLVPETIAKFKVQEAMKYHNYQDNISELISRKKANLNALFFSVQQLFGFEVDLMHKFS